MGTKEDVGRMGNFLGAPRSSTPNLAATVSTVLGDGSRRMLMPGWMDQHHRAARLLGAVMIAITRQNEIPTELKALTLIGTGQYLSSHPSKIVNWHMLRNTLILTYEELRPFGKHPFQFPEMRPIYDYSIRGFDLEGMNFFDFIMNTYEVKRGKTDMDNGLLVPYIPGSRKEHKARVVRPSRHAVVPEMMGGWPVASDDRANRQLYEASILLLFNPWRDIKELKSGQRTFGDAFALFEEEMPNDVRRRMDNIEAYHTCMDS